MNKRQRTFCVEPDCGKQVVGRGLCNAHYKQWRRNGSIEVRALRARNECSIDGCGKWARSHSLCQAHALRFKLYGNPTATPLKAANGTVKGRACTFDGCDRPMVARGYCAAHYARRRLTPERLAEPLGVKRGAFQQFLREALKTASDDCIFWPSRSRTEYINVRADGQDRCAHNLICELEHGPRPTDQHETAHSCGNGGCLNRRHVRWATHQENEADKKIHGTKAQGERQGNAKLTAAKVIAMRRDNRILREIAADYDVSIGHVWNVKNGDAWKHVPLL